MSKRLPAAESIHLRSLIESGHIASKEQLLEEVRRQGWNISLIGDDFISIRISGGRAFRFRFCLDGAQEVGWVYALIATDADQRACYIGSTKDFQRRMAEHVRVQQLAHLFLLGGSTEFFRWAAQRNLTVRSLLLEKVFGPSNLAYRESCWTAAAQYEGWTLPGVERWGRKNNREIARPSESEYVPYQETYLQAFDLSKAKTLRHHVLGRDDAVKDHPDPAESAQAHLPANSELQMDNSDASQFDRYTIYLLVNPLNRRPFFVGLTNGQESGIVVFDRAPADIARNQIMRAIYESDKQIQAVEVDHAPDQSRATTLRTFWIELMLRSGADIVNAEAGHNMRNRAVQVHLAACGKSLHEMPLPFAASTGPIQVSTENGEAAPKARTRRRRKSRKEPDSEAATKAQNLPARHGERWHTNEQETVAQRYLQGHTPKDIASDQQRKESSILAKLAQMAAKDKRIRHRLVADGLTDASGQLFILDRAGNRVETDPLRDANV
jgi:hypothetical protein